MASHIPKQRSAVSSRAAAAPKTTASAPAEKVAISRAPVGTPSDVWEGVGTHSNPAAYLSEPGVAPTAPAAIARGERQIENLHPQVTRMYVDPNILALQDPAFQSAHPAAYAKASQELGDLKHAVTLALANGGRADLCLWDLPKGANSTPADISAATGQFATLVKQLMTAHAGAPPGSFLVSAQNEPNRTRLVPGQLVSLFKDLNQSLTRSLGAAGRRSVKLVAGEMTEGDHSAEWIQGVVPKLAGVADAFSFHVYRRPGETAQEYEARLSKVRQEVDAAMPKGKTPPELLVTEYGVRGNKPPGDKSDSPGFVAKGGPSLRDSPVGAFEEAQNVIAMARAGFSGGIRWGANPGGGTPWTAWSMTGTQGEGFARKPAYFATQLFTTAVAPGWRAVQTSGETSGSSVAAWRAPSGSGAAAAVANQGSRPNSVALGPFAPGQRLQVLVFNAGGKGKLDAQVARADKSGFVTVSVPPQGVAAATTQLTQPG